MFTYVEDALYQELMEYGGDIIASERFDKAKTVPHHSKGGSIAAHSIETAGYAFRLAKWLNRRGASVDVSDAVRASLLHDIGMTEDDVFLSPSSEKAKTHPREGARIAREEFGANGRQADAILYHMWPFCSFARPHSAEGLVVTAADKLCSLNEVRRLMIRTITRSS